MGKKVTKMDRAQHYFEEHHDAKVTDVSVKFDMVKSAC